MLSVRLFRICAGLALIACVVVARLGAAPAPSTGAEVYRQQCASCHGKSGEGVKKKYADKLVGDWPIEKLTRYIHKSMPEDAPKTLELPQADAVARYIYDAFYSREARMKSNPPRVELVRLTNRQYVNTVADLVKQFTGVDAVNQGEPGLRATYRGGKKRGGAGAVVNIDRVDRAVNFDFFQDGVEPSVALTNGLNGNWSGAVIAEETGTYEFILKTPNGARLWVNDEERPLIDAGVASGTLDEHKAAVRLLGGRTYPLRLEWFKAPKDKLASISLQWLPPRGAQATIPARSLSTARVSPTLVVTTAFPADDNSVGYERGVQISKAWDEAATQSAIEAANYVVRNLDRISKSKPLDADRAAKALAFCNEFVAAAFRRPINDEQKRLYVASHFKKGVKVDDAVKRVVLLTLKSPRFLYLGLEGAKPDDFDAAARLSFGMWDSLPDRELTKLAAEGKLHSREAVSQQAKRMLADPRARSKVRYFLHHWLQIDHVESIVKDETTFPGFSPEIISDLRTSLNLFLDEVVWGSTSDYRRLLLEDDLYVNGRLAKYYGITSKAGDDFVKVELDPAQRSGVLTHPYLLAAFSYPKTSSPIHRGVFLTRNIIGRALRPPPIAVAFKDEEFPANLSLREKVSQLTRPQACQGCHSVINPLGFSLENYDAVGRFRTRDGNRPVDATAEYVTDDGEKVPLKGARDVAKFASGSDQAHEAFVEQLFHQVVKQPMLAYGPDVMPKLRQSFVASGFNLQKLLVEIATVSALHNLEKPALTKK